MDNTAVFCTSRGTTSTRSAAPMQQHHQLLPVLTFSSAVVSKKLRLQCADLEAPITLLQRRKPYLCDSGSCHDPRLAFQALRTTPRTPKQCVPARWESATPESSEALLLGHAFY
ncbi:hypothetical protein CTAM01_03816 [Colletotrichum tamarilloi]|uniref:Uncharacterized protein n=1 Tax=Colletotrichum tamarilloi TaxID=1209934 RepID=A0ABQ9RIK7_9PEZI|nr:uncharacterized protein CTAM01_03816 [Colletotrichum tamarilloi]KAI3527895.1 hypothetical protein CSPX01_16614 [Colletotrichum filicis]KAK1504509.1 hypothetical protein CTAM01_03816 [Colletotrichum tamarilloi]